MLRHLAAYTARAGSATRSNNTAPCRTSVRRRLRSKTPATDATSRVHGTAYTRGTLNSFPRASALGRSMSANAAISRIGNFGAVPRYAPLIAPQPMTPTLTFSGMVRFPFVYDVLDENSDSREVFIHDDSMPICH